MAPTGTVADLFHPSTARLSRVDIPVSGEVQRSLVLQRMRDLRCEACDDRLARLATAGRPTALRLWAGRALIGLGDRIAGESGAVRPAA